MQISWSGCPVYLVYLLCDVIYVGIQVCWYGCPGYPVSESSSTSECATYCE